jgi:hypothetical protein
MGIRYVGDCNFAESTEFVLGVNEFDADSLTRTFEGRSDKLKEFIAKWPKGKPDATYPSFRRRTLVATGRGAFTSVTITFAGLLSGNIPNPKITGGFRQQSTSLKRAGSEETVEVEYRAPYTTYRYLARSKPEKPKYPQTVQLNSIPWEVNQTRGDRSTLFYEVRELGRMGGTIIYTRTRNGYFNYARDFSTSAFEYDQIGDLWEVIEEHEGRIIEIARNDLPRHLYPDYFVGQLAQTT